MIKCDLLKSSFNYNFYNKIVRRMYSNFFGTAKKSCVIKKREIFSFLPLIDNSVTNGLRFLLISTSAVI